MKLEFRTNQERMKHPLIRLMPQYKWSSNTLDDNELDTKMIPILTVPSYELIPHLKLLFSKGQNTTSFKIWSPKTWCLIIALSHPDLELSALRNIASFLELNKTDLFNLLVLIGNKKWINSFINEEETTNDKNPLFYENNFDAYCDAAQNGDLEVVKYIEYKNPQRIRQMIESDNYKVYRCAAEQGHLELLRHLESKASEHIQKMIEADDYVVYRNAARNGHLGVLKHLESKAPKHIQKMIEANQYYAYYEAAENGHLEVLKHLEYQAPKHLQKMIESWNFRAYWSAAGSGHLAILRHLESQAQKHIQKMIEADNHAAYREAAEHGHLEVLKHLESQAPKHIKEIIITDNYYVYRAAAENGHLEVLKHLESKVPEQIKEMVIADEYYAYRYAAKEGHLEVLRHLESKAPEHLQRMIEAECYLAYRWASDNGHLEVLEHLEFKVPGNLAILKDVDLTTPKNIQKMIAQNIEISPHNYVLIRMWPPHIGTKEISYEEAILKAGDRRVNVGHISMAIHHGEDEVYLSHWPPPGAGRFKTPVESKPKSLKEDFISEGKEGISSPPIKYIALYGLDTKNMIDAYKEICKNPWSLFGQNREGKPDKAYSCAGAVYAALEAGGLFEYYVDKDGSLTPEDVFNLAHRAKNRIAGYFPRTRNMLPESIKAELITAAEKGTNYFNDFKVNHEDYAEQYKKLVSNSEYHDLGVKVTAATAKADQKYNSTDKGNELLLKIARLKDVSKVRTAEKKKQAEQHNEGLYREIDKLLENQYANLEAHADDGLNALHKSILKGDFYCTNELIRMFPNMINEVAKTPNKKTRRTVSAAKNGFFAAKQIKDYSGYFPLDLALEKKDEALINLLQQNGAKSRNNYDSNTAHSYAA